MLTLSEVHRHSSGTLCCSPARHAGQDVPATAAAHLIYRSSIGSDFRRDAEKFLNRSAKAELLWSSMGRRGARDCPFCEQGTSVLTGGVELD